jgi:hypothetical protein
MKLGTSMSAEGGVRTHTQSQENTMSNLNPPGDNLIKRTDLLDRMDRDMGLVRAQNLNTIDALTNKGEVEFRQHLQSFKEALRVYQKLVHTELYSPLRHVLESEPRIIVVQQIERETDRLLERTGKLFDKSETRAFSHKMLFVKAFIRSSRLLVKQHEKEKEILYPMLRQNLRK